MNVQVEAGIVMEECASVLSGDVDESSSPACKSLFVFEMVSYGVSSGRVRGKGLENDDISRVGNGFEHGCNVKPELAVLNVEESEGIIRWRTCPEIIYICSFQCKFHSIDRCNFTAFCDQFQLLVRWQEQHVVLFKQG